MGPEASLTLLGVFASPEGLAAALAALRERGATVLEVWSPVPYPGLEAPPPRRGSPVRFFTLAGGAAGLLAGLGLSMFTALQWRLNTGGKPLFGWPAWTVIAVEGCILLAVAATFFGMLFAAGLPARGGRPPDPRFTRDRFGVLVSGEGVGAVEIERILRQAGAEEVRHAAP